MPSAEQLPARHTPMIRSLQELVVKVLILIHARHAAMTPLHAQNVTSVSQNMINNYINLRRSRDCLWVGRPAARPPDRPVWVCVCVVWIRWMFVSSQLRAASFSHFTEVLRCTHKRNVTIMKVYIARHSIQVEITRFHTNLRLS